MKEGETFESDLRVRLLTLLLLFLFLPLRVLLTRLQQSLQLVLGAASLFSTCSPIEEGILLAHKRARKTERRNAGGSQYYIGGLAPKHTRTLKHGPLTYVTHIS